jgi:hypothetical protein
MVKENEFSGQKTIIHDFLATTVGKIRRKVNNV